MKKYTIFIKPAHPDLLVRDPRSKQPLSVDGENKPYTGKEGTYWRRRLSDGSVIEIKEEIKDKKKKSNENGGK